VFSDGSVSPRSLAHVCVSSSEVRATKSSFILLLVFLEIRVFEEDRDGLFDRDSTILPTLDTRLAGINNEPCLRSNGTNKH
jgi:hypothetical protein